MTHPYANPDGNRQFAESYLRELSRYPDGAALILRTADVLRASTSSAQTSTTSTTDGWEF